VVAAVFVHLAFHNVFSGEINAAQLSNSSVMTADLK
jgi:hypothetical protein